MYEEGQEITRDMLLRLPLDHWQMETVLPDPGGKVTLNKYELKGMTAGHAANWIAGHLEEGTLPTGRVRRVSPEGIQIHFGQDRVSVTIDVSIQRQS